jgi:PIN domain nuclease of toxin-antitoxin system
VILIDTHPIIWFTLGESRLGARAREAIATGIEEETLVLSPISLWEASMLVRKGRVTFEVPLQEWVDTILENGIRLAGISPEIAVDAGQLPSAIHGDPADRIIVATARTLRCPLLTSDRQILGYASAGHLQVIDARL